MGKLRIYHRGSRQAAWYLVWLALSASSAWAEGLARAGQIQQAIELADQARCHGELGHEQAMRKQHADFSPT